MEDPGDWCEGGARCSNLTDELADLRAIGDTMQSAFSRVLASLPKTNWADKAGYEAGMATLEGQDAIEKWTEARKGSR